MGCPNFTAPSLRGVELGERGSRCKTGERLPATLARLLMQLHGSSQVSPQSALGNESVRARAYASGAQAAVCFAGVAQLVEHLFCKQVVRGSSPRASSVLSGHGATGGDARASRVLASFSFRSGVTCARPSAVLGTSAAKAAAVHVQKYVPLRSSGKPRHNAELRTRVSAGRGAVRLAELSPTSTALSLARSASFARFVSATVRETSESCPSGQREQAVNLPDLSYAGSNPALSTSAPLRGASVSISVPGSSAPPRRSEFGGAPPQVSGPQPQNSANVRLVASSFAGVAQLVERQPSKLNVEGSSPFSRSQFFGSVSFFESTQAQTFGQTRVASSVAVEAEASIGAERTPVREHRSAAEAKTPAEIATRRPPSLKRHCHAHLAQMVEHVLGKDEVTSSILVVGSKP